jgi:hypothetical protein
VKSRLPDREFGVAFFRAVPFPRATRLFAATGLLASVCLASAAYAQTAPPQNAGAASLQTPSTAEQLPPGTTICAVLEKTLDTKKVKPGDAIVAKTTMAVLAHGKVVIATGARVLGHVTRVTPRSGGNATSQLAVAFDRVVLKAGDEMPLPLTLQAIGYGGLPLPTEDDPGANSPYSAMSSAATGPASSAARRTNFPAPRLDPSNAPAPAPPGITPGSPVLDAGSKGVVGIKGLTLAEGSDAAHGSVISAEKKNVRLDRGSQLILRVVGSNGPSKFPPIVIFVCP